MANAVSKVKLTGSTNGKGILVVATATPGTTIHATSNSASVYDELWLWIINPHTADILATIELGGVTSPGNVITVNVPFNQGLVLCVPGLSLFDAGGGALTVSVFAAVASKLTVFGYVNRVTP